MIEMGGGDKMAETEEYEWEKKGETFREIKSPKRTRASDNTENRVSTESGNLN